MKAKIHDRHNCRICGSTDLVKAISFEQMPLTEDFVTAEELGTEFTADNDIYFCKNCKTVQTQHDVDFTEYYQDCYRYSVGTSPTAMRFMEAIATALTEKYFPDDRDLKVLEVGSGDGGQLLPFKRLGWQVLGYEPSSATVEVARKQGIPTIQGLFDSNSVDRLPEEFREVDLIFLSYTFDHLPDPVAFLRTAKSILNRDRGLLVVEVHNLERIFERREFCLFEHEHSIYLTRSTAQSLLEREGFVAIDFDIVPENIRRANSLIFVASLAESPRSSLKLPDIELPKYDRLEFYQQQSDRIFRGIKNLEKFIDRQTASGKTIAGYGAGGRGIATLAATQNADKLEYLIDKNPHGEGIYSPKSRLPIFGLDKLGESPVDEIIVFSFGYMKEIAEDLKPMGYGSQQLHSALDVLEGKV